MTRFFSSSQTLAHTTRQKRNLFVPQPLLSTRPLLNLVHWRVRRASDNCLSVYAVVVAWKLGVSLPPATGLAWGWNAEFRHSHCIVYYARPPPFVLATNARTNPLTAVTLFQWNAENLPGRTSREAHAGLGQYYSRTGRQVTFSYTERIPYSYPPPYTLRLGSGRPRGHTPLGGRIEHAECPSVSPKAQDKAGLRTL